MGAQTLFIIAGIFFAVGLILALVVLLWTVGGCNHLKARINSAVQSPVPNISDGLKAKSSSSDETVYKQSSDETVCAEEDGVPVKGTYDLTPIVELGTPKNERSDASFAEDLETPSESEVSKGKIGSNFKYLCVIEKTYPQEKPSLPRGSFISLENDR